MSYKKEHIDNSSNKVIATADSYFQYAKEVVISNSWEPLLHFGTLYTSIP